VKNAPPGIRERAGNGKAWPLPWGWLNGGKYLLLFVGYLGWDAKYL
jgi:hypothetical protein